MAPAQSAGAPPEAPKNSQQRNMRHHLLHLQQPQERAVLGRRLDFLRQGLGSALGAGPPHWGPHKASAKWAGAGEGAAREVGVGVVWQGSGGACPTLCSGLREVTEPLWAESSHRKYGPNKNLRHRTSER